MYHKLFCKEQILPDFVLHLSFFYSWLQERGYIDLLLVGQRNGLEETSLSLKLQPIRIQQLCKSIDTWIIWIELTTICIISLLWSRVYNNQSWSRIWDGTNPPESSHSSQKQGFPRKCEPEGKIVSSCIIDHLWLFFFTSFRILIRYLFAT